MGKGKKGPDDKNIKKPSFEGLRQKLKKLAPILIPKTKSRLSAKAKTRVGEVLHPESFVTSKISEKELKNIRKDIKRNLRNSTYAGKSKGKES